MFMEYTPISAVWEVTMGCNMRCGHCGSSCTEALPDELTTEEAMTLIDELAKLKLSFITLSGGEPLTRKDLPLLVKRLSSHGILTNIITNGWLLSRETARILKESAVCTIGVSVDGTEEIHDSIRKPGSFKRLREAFGNMSNEGIHTSAITTITKRNIDNLPQLRDVLFEMNVDGWQLQLGLPMGNLKKHQDWIIGPEQIDDVIDFCYETSMKNRICIYPADNIGYCTKKELYTRRNSFKLDQIPIWKGCNAGVSCFGILHNGDIVGCTSIREPEFIEGNIRDIPLHKIWNDPSRFAWRRQMTKSKLQGDCQSCRYGDRCLGGCSNVRLTMNGSIYSENIYCAYNSALKKLKVFTFNTESIV